MQSFCGELWSRPKNWFSENGMTAILTGCLREAVFIGADSRKWDSLMHAPLSDEVQKVFEIRDKSRKLAYALTGSVASANGVFDLVQECRRESVRLASRNFESLRTYVEPFIHVIRNSLTKGKAAGELFPPDEVIVRMFVVGFIKKRGACQALLTFTHDKQVLQEAQVACGPVSPGWMSGSGCEVAKQMVLGDSTTLPIDTTLSDAAELTKRLIEAHKEHLQTTGHEFCNLVGGPPQFAMVTFANGFEWLPGYEPACVLQG
jgi:hypothetical protein